MAGRTTNIVVAGDVTIDWLVIPILGLDLEVINGKTPPNYQLFKGARMIARPGGALLLAKWISDVTGVQVRTHHLTNIESIPPTKVIHSLVELEKYPYSKEKKDEKRLVYRVKELRGFCGPEKEVAEALPIADDDANADVIVLDDAGNGFRDVEKVWPSALRSKTRKPVIIYKNSRPLAKGKLWERVQQDPDRLIVIVSADDLRAQPHGLYISRHLSWERTAKDFVWQMASNAQLLTLANCANLIVRFGIDGAIHYKRREGRVESRLYYDPAVVEDGYHDQFPGGMIGLTAAFVAALTNRIAVDGIEGIHEGIRDGIHASRRLLRFGFASAQETIDYPGKEIFASSEKDSPIFDASIPAATASEPPDPEFWCILNDQSRSSVEEIAYNVVRYGEASALQDVPMGQFGNLKTVDRAEIESYRSIKNLMLEYLGKEDSKRPLSIAVFGPPGSGKSFGVAQVAESIAPGKIEKIEFNVAQFQSTADLVSALHKVRDLALSAKIPLVFFDEFDSSYEGEIGWLKYFLAPMQDGKFKDGETMHPVGKAIFVFAGGTAKTLQHFSGDHLTGPAAETFREKFKNAKGPDFVSRLRGYVNILGPNPTSENDNFYMIRRAMLFRSMLKLGPAKKYVFDSKDRALIDEGVIRAFLKIPKFEHGARSIEAIIDMSMLKGRKSYEQAALPPVEQLQLHVDADMFNRLVVRDVLFGSARELLAKAIHEKYRRDQKGKKKESDPAMQPWEKLAETLRESNRQQADDIPGKLRKIGCGFAPAKEKKPVVFQFTEEEIEILAEMEHERWVKERLLSGWSYGKQRDVTKNISPYLVPWNELPNDVKGYDRDSIRSIPQVMADAKFEIYRLERRR